MKMRQITTNQPTTRFLMWFDEKNRAHKSTSDCTQIDFQSRANQLLVPLNTSIFFSSNHSKSANNPNLMWFGKKNRMRKSASGRTKINFRCALIRAIFSRQIKAMKTYCTLTSIKKGFFCQFQINFQRYWIARRIVSKKSLRSKLYIPSTTNIWKKLLSR